jgi:hypothetical protein
MLVLRGKFLTQDFLSQVQIKPWVNKLFIEINIEGISYDQLWLKRLTSLSKPFGSSMIHDSWELLNARLNFKRNQFS